MFCSDTTTGDLENLLDKQREEIKKMKMNEELVRCAKINFENLEKGDADA